MSYVVYKINNLINKKYYIGVHKTNNHNDSYMGSGKRILASIEKYGIENFNKEILYEYDEPTDAFNKEKQILDECLEDPNCYNLKDGGLGGWDYVHINGLTNKNKHRDHYVKMAKKNHELRNSDPERYKRWYESVKDGITHSELSKIKIGKSVSQRRKNKCYITDGIITREHDNSLPIPDGFKKGRTLKKLHV